MTKRILARAETSGRTDDNAESLIKRFKTHQETSMPVIAEFDSMGLVRRCAPTGRVAGRGSVLYVPT